jgi:hypothetical protein
MGFIGQSGAGGLSCHCTVRTSLFFLGFYTHCHRQDKLGNKGRECSSCPTKPRHPILTINRYIQIEWREPCKPSQCHTGYYTQRDMGESFIQ